jgi:hypothetical protein
MTETERIISIPREHTAECRAPVCPKPGGSIKLWPVQHEALWAVWRWGGGFFPIGVGHGKTFIAVLAGTAMGKKRSIIFTKPGLVGAMGEALALAQESFHLTCLPLIIPYSHLSDAKMTDYLDSLTGNQSDLVIVADEVHCLKDHTSARTRRVMRFFEAHPEVSFVGLSGTITSKTPKDYAHLAYLALRDHCPVPIKKHDLEMWHEVFGSQGKPAQEHWDWVRPFLQVFGAPTPPGVQLVGAERKAHARRALQLRLRTCPGVVATQETALGTSLVLRKIKARVPELMAQKLEDLHATQCSPDGEPLLGPADEWRFGRQLSLGYHYRPVWPGGEPDFEWLDARSDWLRHVRSELQHRAGPGYDSPKLVEDAVRAGGTNIYLRRAFEAWEKVRDRPGPEKETVWFAPDFLERVLGRVKTTQPTIIWYESHSLEEKCMEFVPTYGAGVQPPEDGRGTVAMSWLAHGTGRNLQKWARNVFLEPPAGGEAWEQLLGRTHRPGQAADEVEVLVACWTESLQSAVESAKKDARYIQDSTGNVQKLNLGTWGDELWV